jgi:hypothetical protein
MYNNNTLPPPTDTFVLWQSCASDATDLREWSKPSLRAHLVGELRAVSR